MSNRTCSVDGCEKPHKGRGWCNMHYTRWSKTGELGEPKRRVLNAHAPTNSCSLCKLEKPTSNFYTSHGGTRLQPYCIPCFLVKSREREYFKKYGITVPEYEAMLAKQGGKCAICDGDCRTGQRLSVDHDHVTGAVRGILCKRCNTGLGYFNDRPELLVRASGYLSAK